MTILDIIIAYRVAADPNLIQYLTEKNSLGLILDRLPSQSSAKAVIVVDLLIRVLVVLFLFLKSGKPPITFLLSFELLAIKPKIT